MIVTALLMILPLFVNGLYLSDYELCALFVISWGTIYRYKCSVNKKWLNTTLSQDGHFVLTVGLVFIIATVVGAYSFTALGFQGLVSRDLLREDVLNYNFESDSFLEAQIGYLSIIFVALIFGYALKTENIKLLLFATVFSTYILTSTGTRWHWILAISPVATFLIVNLKYYISIFLMVFSFVPMLYISANRSSGGEMDIDEVAKWDIPTFQSYSIVERIQSDFANITDFFNGQILILIPRFIWQDKPADKTITNYMIGEIGDAFNSGATILPGFIGSSWLYGGVVGIIFFSAVLFFFLSKTQNYYFESRIDNLDYTGLGLSFCGLILQNRGISVFYIIPFVYYYVGKVLVSGITGGCNFMRR